MDQETFANFSGTYWKISITALIGKLSEKYQEPMFSPHAPPPPHPPHPQDHKKGQRREISLLYTTSVSFIKHIKIKDYKILSKYN